VSWIADELKPLLAIAAATLSDDGTLLEANAGFLRVGGAASLQPRGARAGAAFVQPSFAALAAAVPDADGEVYHGLLTIGDRMAETRTLRGRVWRDGAELRLLAEYDIDELERLNAKMLDLNRDYANAQFELAQTNLKLQQREAQIVALALTDSLTGLGNHRKFEQELATEIKRSQRSGEPLCAVMADLDHFKRINDTYGHETGDRLLAAFGELLRKQTRAPEIGARIGGEEFVLLMPRTDLADGVVAAERIRSAIAELRLAPVAEAITSSFGVAMLAAGEAGDAFMRRVDQALYGAKHSGRNCVVAG
jgi:diguanylate cyclase (GGDEF)-like protein